MVSGLSWAGTCAAIGGAWALGAAWRAGSRPSRTLLRFLAGGVVAVTSAAGLYALLGAFGVDISWEDLALPGWSAVVGALLVGSIEESAKLAGVALALTSRAPRSVARATIAVSAVFALAEAFVAVEGLTWKSSLARALLAPVAHGALAIPFAWAMVRTSRSPELPRPTAAGAALRLARIAAALGIAAALHGAGDWSLAQEGFGRVGFALAMVAPVVWLYWRVAGDRSPPVRPASVIKRARSSSATPHACAMHPRGV